QFDRDQRVYHCARWAAVGTQPWVFQLFGLEETAIIPRKNHNDGTNGRKVDRGDRPGRKYVHLGNAHAMCRVCLRAESEDRVELAFDPPGPACGARVLCTEMFEFQAT